MPGFGSARHDAGVPRVATTTSAIDLLNLPRPKATAPVGLREDRRGLRSRLRVLRDPALPGHADARARSTPSSPRSSRSTPVRSCSSRRTCARYGRDAGWASSRSSRSSRPSRRGSTRVRLLYLYPSDLTDDLIDAICATGRAVLRPVVAARVEPLLRRMRRWGDGDKFLARIEQIRALRARRRVPFELHRRLSG